MPSFQEFVQKRQQQQGGGQGTPNFVGEGQRPQAEANRTQQPRYKGNDFNVVAGFNKAGEPKAAPQGAGGSAVNSSGRIAAGGEPPLWQQQAQFDNQAQQAETESLWLNHNQAQEQQNSTRDWYRQLIEKQMPQASAAPSVPPPTTADPFQGNGVWTGQQWVPKDHPLAQGVAASAGGSGVSAWQANGPQLSSSMPGYNAPTFTQWQGPMQGEQEAGMNTLLSYMLQNPESMTPEGVAQLKETQKDSGVSMANQLNQQIKGEMAARGLTGGGMEQAALNDTNNNLLTSLLSGYRDIDTKKMLQDRADQLGVVGAVNTALTGHMGRASEGYGNTLAGQQAQDSSNRFESTFGQGQWNDVMNLLMQKYGITNQNEQNALNRGLQEKLGMADVGLGQGRLNEDIRQFNQMYPLNAAQILGNLGLGYGNLNLANRQFTADDSYRNKNAFLNWLFA